jgi:Na+-driven multidrug efflux pump
MFLFIVWHSIFAYFSNGIEKTNIQLVTTAIGALINIPLSVIFVKYFNLGIDGIILATIISLLIYCILGPIEAFKEINKMKEINNNENN